MLMRCYEVDDLGPFITFEGGKSSERMGLKGNRSFSNGNLDGVNLVGEEEEEGEEEGGGGGEIAEESRWRKGEEF
jgi:hypothetical protein